MIAIFVSWVVAATVLLWVARALGKLTQNSPFGILIDNRGRYSLTQFQLVLWTIVVLSLVAGVAAGRIFGGAWSTTLDFNIPKNLLIVMGISLGSTATAMTIKAAKDQTSGDSVAASGPGDPARFSQIFLQDTGAFADKVVDPAKYQNFWITLIVVGSYIALAIAEVAKHANAVDMSALPDFSETILVLLGVSHAGYLAGKLPNQEGKAPGYTIAGRAAGAVPKDEHDAKKLPASIPSYEPRNQKAA